MCLERTRPCCLLSQIWRRRAAGLFTGRGHVKNFSNFVDDRRLEERGQRGMGRGGGEKGRRWAFATVCSSNMNRSMEAHFQLQNRGHDVRSFGTVLALLDAVQARGGGRRHAPYAMPARIQPPSAEAQRGRALPSLRTAAGARSGRLTLACIS